MNEQHKFSGEKERARALFLPICREDMKRRGWDELDFLYVSGDAYVDHPSFAAALICRLLESRGHRVGILAQPNWRSEEAFRVMGRPKLGVLVGAGSSLRRSKSGSSA